MNTYDFLDLYLTGFFTTLGQLSGMAVSATVALPMYNYYMNTSTSTKSNCSNCNCEETVDVASSEDTLDSPDSPEDVDNENNDDTLTVE